MTTPRTGISLEHRATPAAARDFAVAAGRLGRALSEDDARDILTALLSPRAAWTGETVRSWCRYRLTRTDLGNLATHWANTPTVVDDRDVAELRAAVDGNAVALVPWRIDCADAIVAAALDGVERPVVVVTARSRVGGAWFAARVVEALRLGTSSALSLQELLAAHRPVLVIRHAGCLSLAAATAFSAAHTGRWPLLLTGYDAPNGVCRGPLDDHLSSRVVGSAVV